jgi:cob(I)alamin adenosyltransferase
VSSRKPNGPEQSVPRIYTRTGDEGKTSLFGGQRISKDATRIEAYGTVDELNAFIGLARQSAHDLAASCKGLGRLVEVLQRIQSELFKLGSMLARLEKDFQTGQPALTETDVEQLEKEIDSISTDLPVLRHFVLPGGSRLNAELHICRTLCRRAERSCVRLEREENGSLLPIRYLNRLADALFVWSRWANHVLGEQEILWESDPLRKRLSIE